MNNIKKALFLILALIFLYDALSNSYRPVLYSVSGYEAEKRLNSEKNYYLISTIDCSGGTEFVFSSGELKGEYVKWKNSPLKHFETVFLLREQTFLVDVEEIRSISESSSEVICPRSYEITAKSWQIVYPIYRDYTYTPHERWFYPKSYIDQYDVNHGDYIP